ncbi:hypothetical protein niasHT_031297 [Heterodera trifolii]|uniref:Uncharacterized protein n=1 Tax=Heterodera trifolii TaxID=157864 RepID=A0ABD2IC92_9BILA
MNLIKLKKGPILGDFLEIQALKLYKSYKILGALGLSELGDAIPQPNQPAQVVQQAPVVHQRHDVTLPPITLPKFSGEPREWPLFWKLFETSVESLQIEDFKKHIYFLGCLPEKSIARRAIDLYPPSDENYPKVVEILKKRFGDEKTMVIYHSLLGSGQGFGY